MIPAWHCNISLWRRSAITRSRGRVTGTRVAGGLTVASVTPLSTSSGRVQALDATRGIAMLFVCISHFSASYFGRLRESGIPTSALEHVALIASPTFVTLSGLLLGFLARTRPRDSVALRAKLVDRGLFMLTAGHLLIVVAHIPIAGGLGPALEWGFITDVIAIGLL